jgi:hypothetical protein
MKHFRFIDTCAVLVGVFIYPIIIMWACKAYSRDGAELYKDMGFIYTNITMAFIGFIIALTTVYYFHVKSEGKISSGNRIAGILIALICNISCLILYLAFLYTSVWSKSTSSIFDKDLDKISAIILMTIVPFIWSSWYLFAFYNYTTKIK